MTNAGVQRLYVKRLAENDNSKQQVYLGGDFTALSIFPYGEVTSYPGGKVPNFKASIDMAWLLNDGTLCPAPGAQLILYPQYPEVRLSGFLKGCSGAPSGLFRHEPLATRYRLTGRKLFLGITSDARIIAYAVPQDSEAGRAVDNLIPPDTSGVFHEIRLFETVDRKLLMLRELKRIHLAGWIDSKRLQRDGTVISYNSPNAGGYTLEAELGIIPNGRAEPDFMGWEVKQYGVNAFDKLNSSRITLMTPEPDRGFYGENGTAAFVRRYGYPDQSGIEDRLNFSSVHRYGQRNARTGLTLVLDGYNPAQENKLAVDGGIHLVDESGSIAAGWSFAKILEHWRVKHAQAVYVPSMSRKAEIIQYSYGSIVRLGEQSDFTLALKAITGTQVFYDPGIKLEKASTSKSKVKARSQFRVLTKDLNALYKNMTDVDLLQQFN
jgi:hypothetical protein